MDRQDLHIDISTVAEQIVTIQTVFETSLLVLLNCEDCPYQSLYNESLYQETHAGEHYTLRTHGVAL